MASLVWGVQDLVIEDREVEGETQADRVSWSKVGLGDFGSVLVRLKGLVCRDLSLVAESELGEVAVIIALPVNDVSAFVSVSLFKASHILW